MELHIYTTESGISCYNAGNSSSMCNCISRASNKLLASHNMPLTNGCLIIICEFPVFLKSQVPVVEMQKCVLFSFKSDYAVSGVKVCVSFATGESPRTCSKYSHDV